MAIAYFDCFSGIAGDMVLAALVDCGLPFSHLKKELSKLNLKGYTLKQERKNNQIAGTKIHVLVKQGPNSCDYKTIREIINTSKLSKSVKDRALSIFERLARAEAKVHGVSLDKVHFHEVGDIDSIIDIVGSAIGFDYFGFKEIYSSPLPITRGRIKAKHGLLPVPAPATAHLIKGIPLEKAPVSEEIVTPTGAAIITTMAKHFGECPLQKVEKVGYGFGDKVFPKIPNALRLMIGEGYPVVIIEANIDDMNPQVYDYVMERLFKVGAVDVTLQSIQMKKNRPGILLQCQAPWNKKDAAMDVILKETTSIGVRYYPVERKVLRRELKTICTKYGPVRVKVVSDDKGQVLKHLPEYEDVKKLSLKSKRPILNILQDLRFSNNRSESR